MSDLNLKENLDSKNNKVEADNTEKITGKITAAGSKTLKQEPVDNFEFMKEQIKERPVNRKKLLRRTIITASLAIIFGLIACITFLLLEPLFSNYLYPEEETQVVTFPEAGSTEEMLPEDMLIDEEQTVEEDVKNLETEEASTTEEATTEEPVTMQAVDYEQIYSDIHEIGTEGMKSIVTVEGVTSDVDLFNDTYENKGQTSGLIVADNGKELLILVNEETVKTAETIRVTFCDGSQVEAAIKQADAYTGLAIIAIGHDTVAKTTMESITTATLGNSSAKAVVGTPVIAIGSPMGYAGSMCFGMITSSDNAIELVDSDYKLITTDIYGSQTASGVIMNLQGQVIGITDQDYMDDDMKNLLSGIGISELKPTIARLSNAESSAYLGIFGKDVTSEARSQLGVPVGTYVTGIEMDSPAMNYGIQSGDVITKIGTTEIVTYSDYINAMGKCEPFEVVAITIMRQGKDGYQEMTVNVTLGTLE